MGYIRFALAILVLGAHAGFDMTGTAGALVAVQAFFIISGTYMAAVWSTKYSTLDNGTSLFYLNRVVRLYPTYLLLFGLTWLSYMFLDDGSPGHEVYGVFKLADSGALDAGQRLVIASSALIWGQDFLSIDEKSHLLFPIRQGWSIAIELLFYLSAPLLFTRIRSGRWYLALFAFFLVVKWYIFREQGWRYSYFAPWANFGYFMLGVAVYHLSTSVLAGKLKRAIVWPRAVATLLFVLLIFFGEASFERTSLGRHLAFVLLFGIVVLLMFSKSSHKVDTYLGNVSYGVYLNHLLLKSFGMHMGYSGKALPYFVLISSVLVAFAIEQLVQAPFDRIRNRITERSRTLCGGREIVETGSRL